MELEGDDEVVLNSELVRDGDADVTVVPVPEHVVSLSAVFNDEESTPFVEG